MFFNFDFSSSFSVLNLFLRVRKVLRLHIQKKLALTGQDYMVISKLMHTVLPQLPGAGKNYKLETKNVQNRVSQIQSPIQIICLAYFLSSASVKGRLK